MAKLTAGQFAVSECVFKVKVQNSYVTIADIEEIGLSIENDTKKWYSITDGGWQNALLTGKAFSGSFKGKRTLGDVGNDYIDSLRLNIGKAAEADFKVEFPNGATLEFTAIVGLNDILGEATDVVPLSGDLTGKGKPKFTPAS
jgi:hypothetical protein